MTAPMPMRRPSGRTEFVEQTVAQFQSDRGIEVDRLVIDFILSEALISETEWLDALEARRFDPSAVRQALYEGLLESARLADERDANRIERDVAVQGFHTALSWQCEYPWLIC